MDSDKSFYEILGVPKDAKLSIIRKAYYKLALKLHPDRNENKEQATKDFQKLCLIKETLFNARKRKHYDQFGEVDQSSGDFDTSYEYWRARFEKVTFEAIEKFKVKYKNSDEEKEDLRAAYKEHKGNMESVMDSVPLASFEDVERFIDFFDSEIAAGNLKRTKLFRKSRTSVSREEDLSEAKEAEELAQQLGIKKTENASDMGSLQALILQRKKSREQASNSFLASLEAKYSGGGQKKTGKKKRSKKEPSMPSEKEFLRIQKEMEKNKKQRKR